MESEYYEMYLKEVAKNEKLEAEMEKLEDKIEKLEEAAAKNKELEAKVKKFEESIVLLNAQVSKLKSILNTDSNNSGIPTSLTSIGQPKRIPNTREKSDKKIGGQVGHKKSKLDAFEDEEITERQHHQTITCSNCGSGETKETGDSQTRDEYEIKVTVKKIRHHFNETKCSECDHIETPEIPIQLHAENQYGVNIQAILISLLNQGFVSMSRTKEMMFGMTGGIVNVSVGYVAKLQKRLALALALFMIQLRLAVIASDLVQWDDTVIFIAKKRACLRVYVAGDFAYYAAHQQKNKKGIDKDGILLALNEKKIVMHDHNKVNYNDDYCFLNAECCRHLNSDLQKMHDNIKHSWALELKKLLSGTNVLRNEGQSYDVEQVRAKYDELINLGFSQNEKEYDRVWHRDAEVKLLKRLIKYKDNYLMWLENPIVPFTNNESERSLRMSKTKMKVSGQFQNVKNAEYFATIRSYIETGRRHGFNPIYIIIRALKGDFVSLEEMIEYKNQCAS